MGSIARPHLKTTVAAAAPPTNPLHPNHPDRVEQADYSASKKVSHKSAEGDMVKPLALCGEISTMFQNRSLR